MAMAAGTTWEIQTGGNDLNGGGFVTGSAGTNYSLNAGKNVATGTDDSTTDVVTNGTTTITSATANFQASCVGNVIYLQGGTGAVAAARYRIVSRTSATAVVVDRTTGLTAGTGVTMNIGGALLSPAYAFHATQVIPVSGNSFYIKAGTYTISSASTNISNGCIATTLGVYIKGYQTSREDMGTPPLLQASGITTFTLLAATGSLSAVIKNINCDGAGLTASRGFGLTGTSVAVFVYCNALNCTNNGFGSNAIGAALFFCTATGCSTQQAIQVCNAYGCVAFSNTITGFSPSTSTRTIHIRCISYDNSGATTDGFDCASNQAAFIQCTSYNNGRNGFKTQGAQGTYINCIAEGHASGWGFTNTGDPSALIYFNCAGFDNNSGDMDLSTGLASSNDGFITGTASFFTNPGAGDFSLNNTAGGGADARAAGVLGTFPDGLTVGFLDVGAAQHQDPSPGGGGEHSAVF